MMITEVIITVLMCALVFFASLYIRKKLFCPIRHGGNIGVTVVITAKGDSPELEQTLRSYISQMENMGIDEILVVDDGMSSDARKVCELMDIELSH